MLSNARIVLCLILLLLVAAPGCSQTPSAEDDQNDAGPALVDASVIPDSSSSVTLVSMEVWEADPPRRQLQTARFLARAVYSDDATADVTVDASWRSTEPLVATAEASGHITVYRQGSTTITATYEGVVGGAEYEVALRYDQVRQKSVHNTYERHEGLLDVLLYHRVRSIELDLHKGRTGHSAVATDWYVYHVDVPFMNETSVFRLSDALANLRAFHLAEPQHEVVTVFMDMKDGFDAGSGHGPDDLDGRLRAGLGTEAVFGPRELLTWVPGTATLKEAIDRAGWPTLAELRGKFIFVLTDQDLAYYATGGGGGSGADRAAFVAHGYSDPGQIDEHDYQVFFNLNASSGLSKCQTVYDCGYVSRAYGVDDVSKNATARAEHVHHIAADQTNYHEDPWTITHNPLGWPFEVLDLMLEDYPSYAEPDAVVNVRVDSGDIWGLYDDFAFWNQLADVALDWDYRAYVTAPSSHVEEWAKGCLMARANFSGANGGEDSPYFAVCRLADKHKLRVQYRRAAGDSTTAVESDIVASDTTDPENLVWLRLELYSGSTCGRGYGSLDGQDWVLIHEQCGLPPLSFHGLAACSHDGGTVKFVFGRISWDDGLSQGSLSSQDLSLSAIGNGFHSSTLFDGWF